MDISIIGTGNTATVLGRKLQIAHHTVVQIVGRDIVKVTRLAEELNAAPALLGDDLLPAELYIIAVSDHALKEIVTNISVGEKILVHTAASVSKNVLKQAATRFGVFYPLQSLQKSARSIPDIPIVIDANNNATLEVLGGLAKTLSNDVFVANDEQRRKIHLAAVFVNNFVNHIYALAEQYCAEENLDFQMFLPLINETAQRLGGSSARYLQTGPAIRRDADTIQKHLLLLAEYPQLKNVYQTLTDSIYITNQNSNDGNDHR